MSAAAVMAVLATGCLVDRPYDRNVNVDNKNVDQNTNNTYRPVRAAVDGRLHGEVGPLTGLDHDASLLSAYDDGYYLSVETVVQLQDRAVMTLLSVSNGAEIFQPGLDATFTLDNYDSEGVQVTMLGCVGQDVGVYDEYDMPADEVHVSVEPGTGVDDGDDSDMTVSLQARWYDRDDSTGQRLATSKNASTEFTLLR
jgi:hypothetical protein